MGSTSISQIPSRALRTLGDDGLGHGASNGIVPTIGEVGLGCSGGSELDSTGVPFPILAPEQIANLYYPVLYGGVPALVMKNRARSWNRTAASR